MKYSFLFILFILFLFTLSFHQIEGFINTKTIILLGDSILKNDAYGKSVYDSIIEKNQNQQVFIVAEDNSKIVDIYHQIDNIPITYNSPNTFIFLSVGGNDILSYFVENNHDFQNINILQQMFISYKNVIKSIQIKFPYSKLILLDIYYSKNLQIQKYNSVIKSWNDMIYDYSKYPNNDIYGVVKISNYLIDDSDFSQDIEPSSIGGEKIANLIQAKLL